MSAPAFVTNLSRFGDRVALVDDRGESLSYVALDEAVDALAASLGDARRLVMVEVASTLPAVVAYLAALRGGHAVIVGKAGDVGGAVDEHFRPSAVHVAGREGFEVRGEEEGALDPELAVLFSTSGSTGSAKLVKLSGANLQANAESIAEYLEIDEDEVAPALLPLSYSYGASILSSHLHAGAKVVLTEHSVVDPEFAALFEREGCTSLSGVPYTWELVELTGFLAREWPTLKTLTQAGGRLEASHVGRLAGWARDHHARFFVMYGATECTARMAYLPWEHAFDHSDCIGVAIPGGSFRIVDAVGAIVDADGVPGELVYTGPNVMMGYATERAQLADPAGPNEHFTGDLAERNAQGLYRIVGRLSRFSKIMGLRISLDEVERMARDAGASELAVAGDDAIVAVCLADGAEPNVDEQAVEQAVVAGCGLATDAVLAFRSEDGIPRLHNGKVDYPAILALAHERAGVRRSESVSLRDELAGLLGMMSLEDGESFASLGGDSLTYIQASFAIEGRLGYLPPDWERLPVATLEAFERGEGGAVHAEAAQGAGVSVDMDVLLRALAITAVVFNHTRPDGIGAVPGAMATLLLAVGQNLARFRSNSLFRGEGLDLVRSTLMRYMLPYFVVLIAYLTAKRDFDLPSLFFVSTFVDDRASTFLQPFWFIEVFFQIALLLAGLFAIRPLRDAVAERPLVWGAGAFSLLGAVHVAANVADFWLPPVVLWSGIVALGWTVHFAGSTRARALLSISALAMPWLVPRGTMVGLVLLILVWLPRAPLVFEWLKDGVGRVGAASFQIYILHAVVLTAVGFVPGMRGSWLFPLICIPASLVAGVVLSRLRLSRFWPGRDKGVELDERAEAI